MSARALFSSLLLALILASGINVSAAAAATKAPKAKIALGAKKAKKAKKAKAKKVKKASKASKPRRAITTPAQPAPAPAPAAPATCADTDLVPDAGNLHLIRAALVCLHNQVRAQHGIGALAENGALAAAGSAHSADMVARGYFEHTTPEGVEFSDRILAAGYRGDGWTVGENIAWGTYTRSTPAALMQAWMDSEGHRRNILTRDYREIGFGVSVGTPTGAGTGVTVSAEFGARLG